MSAKMGLSFTAVLFLSVFFLFDGISQATPQFAAMNNAKCIACHVNAQGGGLRNFRGWSYMNSTGLIAPRQIKDANGTLKGLQSNSIFDGRITFGTDLRYQVARSFKSKDAQRLKFWMQKTVYSDVKLTNWAHVEGSYNFAKQKFFSQQRWNAAAVIQPQNSYTQLKVGYFQPSAGLRYDDHTMLVRQVPQADYSNYIPPDYAEYGAEITYDNIDWLTLAAGVFDSESLWENKIFIGGVEEPLVKDRHGNLRLGKAILHSPDLAGGRVNLHLGGSYYGNSSFEVADIFGWGRFTDRIGFNTGFTRTVKPGYRATDNFLAGISLRAFSWAVLDARSENGRTYTRGSKDIKTYAKQTVLGAQIFVIPHVEIRPEYRIMDTERYKSSRWALQAHMFI